MVNSVNTGANAFYLDDRFQAKAAKFKELTGRNIEVPKNGEMPHILSPESNIQLGFFGEFFRVGFSSSDGHSTAVENLSRRFAEMREELLEQYGDDQDTLYKRLGELNQAFESALRSTTLIPLPQTPTVPLTTSDTPAFIRDDVERTLREHEAMTNIVRMLQENMLRHMDIFFEDFISNIKNQDFQTAFDSSMERLLNGESRSLENISYSDAVRMKNTISQWHTITDEHGNEEGRLVRHETSFRAIIRDDSISEVIRREIANLLGF